MKIKSFSFETIDFDVYSEKPEFKLFHVKQTHSNIVLKDQFELLGCEGDGVVAHEPKFPLAIKTADCIPLVLWNKSDIAFLHLGWKGLANKLLNENRNQFSTYDKAFIGPCIHACCFEVSDDFNSFFPESGSYFSKKEKLTFDLVMECKKQVNELFPQIQVQDSGLCTFCHLEFHSYRRNKTDKRLWNIITRK